MRLIVQCSECRGTNMLQLNDEEQRITSVDCYAEYDCAGVDFIFHVEWIFSEYLGLMKRVYLA